MVLGHPCERVARPWGYDPQVESHILTYSLHYVPSPKKTTCNLYWGEGGLRETELLTSKVRTRELLTLFTPSADLQADEVWRPLLLEPMHLAHLHTAQSSEEGLAPAQPFLPTPLHLPASSPPLWQELVNIPSTGI